jgi:hypothetical protein
MAQDTATMAAHLYQVDGMPVAGWRWEGDHWTSFHIDGDGDMTRPINCLADEGLARSFAETAATMRAGRAGVVTLDDEE